MLKSYTCARTQIPIVADRYAGGVDLSHVHLVDADDRILATGRYDGFGRLLFRDGGFQDLDAGMAPAALAAGSWRLLLAGMMSRPARASEALSRPDPGLGRFHDQRMLEQAVAADGFASHFGFLLAYRRLVPIDLALEVTRNAETIADRIAAEVRSGFDWVYRDEAAGRFSKLPEPGFFGEGLVVEVRPRDRDGVVSTFSLDRARSSTAAVEAQREGDAWVGLGPFGFARIWALASARPSACRTAYIGRSVLRSIRNELGGTWSEVEDAGGSRAFRTDAAALAAIGFIDGRWPDGSPDAALSEFFAHGIGTAEFARPSAPLFR